MKIQPSDIGHFKTAAQAQAYDRSQQILEDFRLLTQDVVTLDNSSLDSNKEDGKVVFNGKNLLPLTHRESRINIQVPGGKATYPVDPIYWTEKHVSGEAQFDPASKKLQTLNLEGNRYRYDCHPSNGILGMGKPRTVYVRETGGTNHRYVRETVSTFADGSLEYKTTNLMR